MRLLTAHKILIASAAVFFFAFSFWELKDYRETANGWSVIGAVFYLLVAVALAVYFKSLRKWAQL